MKFQRKIIHNWSKLNNILANTAYPNSEKEILKILKFAKANRKKISMMGHGCSHGDVFYYNNENIVVNTTKFNKILEYNSDKQIITVQSGASILKVNNFLFEKKNLIFVSQIKCTLLFF